MKIYLNGLMLLIGFLFKMKFIKLIFNNQNKDFYILNLIIPVFFIIFALILMPMDQIFYFDTDEGIELTKATLSSQHLLLNHEFWDPQPLLFNILLGKYLNIFGFSIITARIFILFFATLLIWCFTQILSLSVGNIPAIITTLFLILSINFLRLSVSVMQGIPCLALAILGIYFIVLYSKNLKLSLLSLAGISLAISLQLKMITIFFIPVIIIYLLIIIPNFKEKFISILTFLISLSVIFIIIGLLTSSLDLQKIFLFHLSSSLKEAYQNHNSFKDVILIYLQNFDFLLLTIVGIKSIKFKENYLYLLPLLWLVMITVLLLNHKPVWYHYLVLVSVPLIWLSSYGIKQILILTNHHNFKISELFKQKLIIFTLILTLLVIPIKLGIIYRQNNLFIQESQVKFTNVERILTYKNQTHWLFTDIAMYSFYSQINLPPEIAVLPAKRLISGNLNQTDLLEVLNKYQPEQILIERFPIILDQIKPYLETNYQKIYEDDLTKHYILKSLNQ